MIRLLASVLLVLAVPLTPARAQGETPPLRGAVDAQETEATTLRREGRDGTLRLFLEGAAPRAEITLAGRGLADDDERCAVAMVDDDGGPVRLSPMAPLGGLVRYRVEARACPIVLTLVEDGAFAAMGAACRFENADCRADPRGLWGPPAAALAGRRAALSSQRTQAESALAARFAALLEQLDGTAREAVSGEQADFPQARQDSCAAYDGEAAHGFCATRLTEMRAAALAERLSQLPPAAATPPRPVETPAPRTARPAPTPASGPLSLDPQNYR